MNRSKRLIVLATASLTGVAWSIPAAGQTAPDYEAIVRTMRGCAPIVDMASRVACFDRTIQAGEGKAIAESDRGRQPLPQTAPARGFAAESLRTVQRSPEPAESPELVISAVQELARKMYRITLEDSGVWELTEPAPIASDRPRRGTRVIVRRGGLGGFFLEFTGQAPLRAKRIR